MCCNSIGGVKAKMTIQEICKKLKSIGFPIAYYEFDFPPKTIPYIVYFDVGAEFRGSDYSNNIENCSYRVELYTEKKDLMAEKKIEEILNFTHFSKQTVKIKEENIYMIVYEFEITKKLD